MSGGVKEAGAQYQISRHPRAEPVPSEGGDGNPVEVDACPAGYKQTEVGMIPKNWELTKIDEVVKRGWIDKPLDGNHGDIHPKSGDFVNSGIPFVMANNLKNGKVDITNCSFIKKEQADSLQKGFSNIGDVLLTHKATIGNTAVVGELPCEYIMLTPQVTYYRVLNNDVLNNHYLRHYMDGNVFQAILETNSGGGTRSYIGITAQRQLPIVIPPIKEQTSIANALSDVDALITSLEKLITKKRAIKTVAMQQLLTGKKRLPPFDKTHTGYKQTELGEIPEDWEVLTIHDVANVKGGKRLPKGELLLKTPTKHPYIRVADMYVGGVDLSDIRYVPEHVAPIIKNYRIKSEDLFISVAGTLGIVGKVREELDGANLTENADKITDIKADKDYLLYWLMTEKIQSEIESQSTVGAQPKLALGRIENFQIAFPNTTEEQVKISGVLTDMDKESEALQQRLSKTQQLKQGMMQELLTGKTRLV